MKVFHPDESVKSCSHAGDAFDRADDGTFEMPIEAFLELRWHGFQSEPPAEQPAPQEPAQAAAPAKGKKK